MKFQDLSALETGLSKTLNIHLLRTLIYRKQLKWIKLCGLRWKKKPGIWQFKQKKTWIT